VIINNVFRSKNCIEYSPTTEGTSQLSIQHRNVTLLMISFLINSQASPYWFAVKGIHNNTTVSEVLIMYIVCFVFRILQCTVSHQVLWPFDAVSSYTAANAYALHESTVFCQCLLCWNCWHWRIIFIIS